MVIRNRPRASLRRLVLVPIALALPCTGGAQELRGVWADTFHAAMRTSTEVSQLVADARAGNLNAVFPEVRKRGDAYYNSNYEPKATDVSPQSFDPLADLIAKAHNTNTGPRVEVHAWIVTYNIWNNRTTLPTPTNHPYRLHPDWVTWNNSGTNWDGSNYAFDPGHPEVQRHTFNVAMDLVSRYDLDGLHFDYIRYGGREWGYNEVALARFRRLYNRSDTPGTTDPQWLQFRRDQVSALVRKIYLNAVALKPRFKISAATILWAPGITADSDWPSTAAYSDVLQDWRAWMQEGILDLNIPMAYFRQEVYAADWADWSTFVKNHRYNRHAALGPGWYLNGISNSLHQMRSTRALTAQGYRADGVNGYSYAAYTTNNNNGISRAAFLATLTQPSAYDPNPVPIFPTPTNPPVMPWKTSPTVGHLKGHVIASTNLTGMDGATVVLSGPIQRTLKTDATGFYGAVDLPPGNYTVAASAPGVDTESTVAAVQAGLVTTQDFLLEPPFEALFFQGIQVSPGRAAALIRWTTAGAVGSQVLYGPSTNFGRATWRNLTSATHHEFQITGLNPDTPWFFRLVAITPTNDLVSLTQSFRTAGETLLDNPGAFYTGAWTQGSSAPDKYSTNYHYASTVDGAATATAVFTPVLETPGRYDVYVWYPQGANRSTNAPFEIRDSSGSTTYRVNQVSGGGAWRLLAASRRFGTGTNGFVRLGNSTGETTKVVLADAVRIVYDPAQDTPPAGAVPDWWAQHYFGGPVDARLDPDGDGYSTDTEYTWGTSPVTGTSHLELDLAAQPDGRTEVRFWPFLGGREYQLQSRDTVGLGGWLDRAHPAPVADALGGGVILDTNPPRTQLFYRLRVALLP